MAEILILCSGCSHIVVADAQCAGKVVTCPACNEQTRASGLIISFSCPKCNHELVTTKELSGCSFNCPQCEHELCVPAVSQYAAHNTSSSPDRMKTANSNKRTYLNIVGLVCASLIAWAVWHNFSSRKVLSQTQVIAAIPSSNTNAITLDFYGSHSEGECYALFPAYVKAIQGGNFDEATARLTEIKAKLTSPQETTGFWNKAIPTNSVGELLLYSLCNNCKSGQCAKCGGNGFCLECKGDKTCPACKGTAPVVKACDKCYCKQCWGSGLCSVCKGKIKKSCPRCEGRGEMSIATVISCPQCNGRGQKPGLRSADGSSTPVGCLTCRTKGRISSSARTSCTFCNGTGKTTCNNCYGRGHCSHCNGLGRRQYCDSCNNTGKLTLHCQICTGTGKCGNCQGSGSCSDCANTGHCKYCEGKGFIKKYAFVVDTSWLKRGAGYIAFDAVNGKILAEHSGSGSSYVQMPEHTIEVTVSSNQCIGLSTNPSFDWCRNHILK